MGILRDANEIVHVEQGFPTVFDVFWGYRVDMVNDYSSTDWVTLNTHVASFISRDHLEPYLAPFS
jgi:hypothetical protein